MAERDLPKVETRVRFPVPAPTRLEVESCACGDIPGPRRGLLYTVGMQALALSVLALVSAVVSPQGGMTASESHPPLSSSPAVAAVAAAPVPGLLDRVEDSILRIGVDLRGTLTIPESTFDVETGTFVPTRGVREVAITTYRLGSGFVVDPLGYIVTNAHVVDTSTDSISTDLWIEFQNEFIAGFESGLAEEGSPLTRDQIIGFEDAYFAYVGQNASWNNITYNVVVFNPAKTDAIGDSAQLFSDGWSAEIKKLGQPYPQIGKDIAILKIEAGREFSPLVFGDSAKVAAGSNVYVIGYPGIADLSAKSFLIPTLTSGIVSAVKPSDLGDYEVIQIDAAISGGNSGGPVFDAEGRVIGVATFGATEEAGYNWILPISLAREYLNELNIHPLTDSGTNVAGILVRVPLVAWAGISSFFFLMICGLTFVLYKRRHHLPPSFATPVLSFNPPFPPQT